jgi:HTH-type transcriptional regulator/antitoxin HipB
MPVLLPLGNNLAAPMIATPKDLGKLVRNERKALDLTQAELALASGTGMRFISDLENGKPTCQIGKTLTVLKILGIRLELHSPRSPGDE